MTFLSLVIGGNNYDSVDMDTDETDTPAVAVAIVSPNNSKVICDSPRTAKAQPGDVDNQPGAADNQAEGGSGGAVYSNTETIQRRWDNYKQDK